MDYETVLEKIDPVNEFGCVWRKEQLSKPQDIIIYTEQKFYRNQTLQLHHCTRRKA